MKPFSLLLLAVVLQSSSQLAGKKQGVTAEQLPIQCPDSESGPERSFVIIAPFNRFMAAIHWHVRWTLRYDEVLAR